MIAYVWFYQFFNKFSHSNSNNSKLFNIIVQGGSPLLNPRIKFRFIATMTSSNHKLHSMRYACNYSRIHRTESTNSGGNPSKTSVFNPYGKLSNIIYNNKHINQHT